MCVQAPPELGIQWDDQAIQGVHRWLHRLWRLTHSHIHTVRVGVASHDQHSEKIVSATHRAIKHVSQCCVVLCCEQESVGLMGVSCCYQGNGDVGW